MYATLDGGVIRGNTDGFRATGSAEDTHGQPLSCCSGSTQPRHTTCQPHLPCTHACAHTHVLGYSNSLRLIIPITSNFSFYCFFFFASPLKGNSDKSKRTSVHSKANVKKKAHMNQQYKHICLHSHSSQSL